MIVRNRVREMSSGQSVRIVATDPSTHRDFTNFCRFMGHRLIHVSEHDGEYEFVITKG